MIPVTITAINQELNLRTKEQMNFAVIELPDGSSFRAPIDDTTAQALVSLSMKMGVTQAPITSAPVNGHFRPGVAPDGTPSMVFGGGDETSLNESLLEEEVEAKLAGSTAPVHVEAPTHRESGLAKTVSPVKPRLVGKDDYGNPILEYPNGVDPSRVTGTIGEGDEDGVRQL